MRRAGYGILRHARAGREEAGYKIVRFSSLPRTRSGVRVSRDDHAPRSQRRYGSRVRIEAADGCFIWDLYKYIEAAAACPHGLDPQHVTKPTGWFGFFGGLGLFLGLVALADLGLGLVFVLGLPGYLNTTHANLLLDRS